MPSEFLKLSPKITVLPLIHGSGDFAVETRRIMLQHEFDCLAVPLPPSFQEDVEAAIDHLPAISMVIQHAPKEFPSEPWSNNDDDEREGGRSFVSYVPIDPCQAVIAALRIALQERIPREFLDLETAHFHARSSVLPDPYALKKVSLDRFSAAILPAIERPAEGQATDRVITMAARLRRLEGRYEKILFVCSVLDWPWIKDVYRDFTLGIRNLESESLPADDDVEDTQIHSIDPRTLVFMLGELPYITGLYELARARLDDDENLSVDGVKDMLLTARERYADELKSWARKISPKMLKTYFQYVRNLSLVERRMTPDLYTLIVAAQQIGGDQFAVKVAEVAREYPYSELPGFPVAVLGIEEARLADGSYVELVNRLPGQTTSWRTCELKPPPLKKDQIEWAERWNPFGQCSWPPEDNAIENFRTHVKDTAMAMIGNDLARTEKFTSSLKDGLDIRETLRNWHTGDLYVKVLPPARGSLDCVLMLFDSPADPREYPWRITWHAENHDESTLSLFATDFRAQVIGPGIAQSTYGGAMFLFPPRPILDIWRDPTFDYVDTLEERLLSAACFHSNERHIAVLSHAPPGPGWRRLAKRYGKILVHVPLGRFGQETVQKLRMFHVLNGQQIRSFATHFIRKP